MSKLIQAQALVALGGLLLVAGTFGLAGWEIASLAAGVESVLYGLWFVDIDGKPPGDKRGRR